jgi:hypothetical protein
LNNCRGWDGGIGLVATSCMPTGALLSMLIISKVGTGNPIFVYLGLFH